MRTLREGALEGCLVIDLSRVLGGPYCTQVLGDHGADVVKIEPPQGDETRDWGPPFHEGDSAYFLGVNRNKRAMGLDLARPQGRELLLRMLEKADVLVENFKPGTMERWGLGYKETLSGRFPRLVHCRISGFGGDGPWGGLPGYDAIVQAMAGWFSINGEPEGGRTRLGLAGVDMGSGLYSATAILMALLERGRSGKGQFLDVTLYDCAVSLMHPHVPNHAYSGEVPGPTGNAHPNISPYDAFRTATGEIFIGAGNNRAFSRLCRELGCPELAEDPRFADNSDRVGNREALKKELESRLARRDGAEVCGRLSRAGLAAGPVHDTRQVMEHPHTRHRGMVVEKDWYRMSGIPVKMSRSKGAIRLLPPRYGEHTRELLAEFGLSRAEIRDLLTEGVALETRRK